MYSFDIEFLAKGKAPGSSTIEATVNLAAMRTVKRKMAACLAEFSICDKRAFLRKLSIPTKSHGIVTDPETKHCPTYDRAAREIWPRDFSVNSENTGP